MKWSSLPTLQMVLGSSLKRLQLHKSLRAILDGPWSLVFGIIIGSIFSTDTSILGVQLLVPSSAPFLALI
ncbi:hypothetical protein PJP07_31085, partial [Mycobacterium kansasii]